MSARQDEAFEKDNAQMLRDVVPFIQTSHCLVRDRNLSPVDKQVYNVLCLYANGGIADGRTAFPKIRTIATEAGVSENTVRTAIKALVKRGYVECIAHFKDGAQGPNIYILHNYPLNEDRGSKSEPPAEDRGANSGGVPDFEGGGF